MAKDISPENPSNLSQLTTVAIFGPTAVGKTEIAIALANSLRSRDENPIAISADALQVYSELPLLTAAPSLEQRGILEHRLIGFLSVSDFFSVGAYSRLAHEEIDQALLRGRRPIVVGGTGLYLRAALTNLNLKPPPSLQRREYWQTKLEKIGSLNLHQELQVRDAQVAANVVSTDSQRIVRAHELLDQGIRALAPERESQLWTSATRHRTLLIGLTMERELLRKKIDQRVDQMIAAGVVEEVEAADKIGASITAKKALGFSELLAGDFEGMKTKTRRYARRQITWMRKLPNARLIDVTDRRPDSISEEISQAIIDLEQ